MRQRKNCGERIFKTFTFSSFQWPTETRAKKRQGRATARHRECTARTGINAWGFKSPPFKQRKNEKA